MSENTEGTALAEKEKKTASPEEMLSQLLENAKKSGRVAAKDIAAAEEAGAPAEALARFYDAIDAAGIEIDIGAEDLLPPVEDDGADISAETEATDAYTADSMRMYLRDILKIAQEPVSLETPIGEEEDSHLGDFIPDEDASEPSEAASFSLLKEQLMDVLDTLTPREKKGLELRFGIVDGRTRTLEEVGKEFNVTRERIRQIEAKALRKLRHPSRSKKLRDFLN